MLESEYKEAKENRMKMEGISTATVNALLAFIYCDDLKEAVASCSLAFDLLKCADQYDISDLWKSVATIFVESPASWYELDVAVGLFDFVNNCAREESKEKLSMRLIRVLKWYGMGIPY